MATVAAPVIVAEMADWVALGGGNSGIVGDPSHTYGFHKSAEDVPASDYSRRRDPNGADGPFVNWKYACAGDFRHGGDPDLRAMHRDVLAGLMAGEYPMICEFIGQPWADRPVYYWARWNGIKTLQRYTGAGHDMWSHASWYRSRVDERAHLWRPTDQGGDPLIGLKKGDRGEPVYALQNMLRRAGHYDGESDGIYGPKTSAAVLAARKSQGSGATDGDRVTGDAYAQIHAALAQVYAGKDGKDGKPGPAGPPGQVDLPAQIRGNIALTGGQATITVTGIDQ